MLDAKERVLLEAFVNRNPPGTPYRRRARIVLLDDQGATQEAIAAEVQVPITRVRQMLRAYKREGAALFPNSVWATTPYSAAEPIADVARQVVSGLVDDLKQYHGDLSSETTVTAVHESRKTTRKMRTAFRLFEPYFQYRLLRSYRKRARKFMRRLSKSRDIAVFQLKLDVLLFDGVETGRLTEQDRDALERLASYWQERQLEADGRVRRYLAEGQYDRLLADLTAFGRGDAGEAVSEIEMMPLKTAYLAPILIYQKLGLVRAMGDRLGDLQPERLHALRIGCKELRYTLEFFEGLLGPGAGECLEVVKQLLTHLGDVNDARVHLLMLGEVDEPELADAVSLYASITHEQLLSLREGFGDLWAEFDRPEWRDRLASAVAAL